VLLLTYKIIVIYHLSLILSYQMLTTSLVITAFHKLLISRTFLVCVSKLFFRVGFAVGGRKRENF